MKNKELTPTQKAERADFDAAEFSRAQKRLQKKSEKWAKLSAHYADMLEMEFNHYIDGINRFPSKKQELFNQINFNWKSFVNKANRTTSDLNLSEKGFELMVKHYELCLKLNALEPKLKLGPLAGMTEEAVQHLIKDEAARQSLIEKIENEIGAE